MLLRQNLKQKPLSRQRQNNSNPNLLTYSQFLWQQGIKEIIGIDEVGRGCLAGSLLMCAFHLKPDTEIIAGVNDSKKLTPKAREQIASQLKTTAQFEFAEISGGEITERGLAFALNAALRQLLPSKQKPAQAVLIDGQFACLKTRGQDNWQQIVRGDQLHYPIAAASILAKVQRDQQMRELSPFYQQWQMAEHKGYGTSKHLQLIKSLGVSDIHRLNFEPLKNWLQIKAIKLIYDH